METNSQREIRLVPLADLKPYERNARTHSDAQVAKIAASIEAFGWTNPVLVTPDLTIIAGHGRVMAAQRLGLDTAPALVVDGWTAEQVRAYVIADNQLAIEAGWDESLLRIELGELKAAGFDLTRTPSPTRTFA